MPNARWETGPIYDWHYDYYLSGNAPDGFTALDPERIADEKGTPLCAPAILTTCA